MSAKCYWLMSDMKTVREISWGEYSKLRDGRRNVKLALVWDTEMHVFEAVVGDAITLHRKQLDQIWRTEEAKE